MSLLYAAPESDIQESTMHTPVIVDPILAEAIKIINNQNKESEKTISPTDFCFRKEGIISLSPCASRSIREISNIIWNVQRVYDELKLLNN